MSPSTARHERHTRVKRPARQLGPARKRRHRVRLRDQVADADRTEGEFTASGSVPTIALNNGVDIPQIGYGVFLTPPEETERTVLGAFEVGYRHIDTVQVYRNEEGVDTAAAANGLPYEDILLITKVRISNVGEGHTVRPIDGSLRRPGADYIGPLLVHQPFGDYYGTYRAMERALVAGKVRAAGVFNFFPGRLVDLAQYVEVPPTVNQMKTHIFNQQADNCTWYTKYDTTLESWGPLTQDRNSISTHPVLTFVGEKYGRTVTQVALRYLIRLDIIVIPKTAHRERMVTNLDVTDFQLNGVDIRATVALDKGQNIVSHYNPAFQERLASYTVEADWPPDVCGHIRLPVVVSGGGLFSRAGASCACGNRIPAPDGVERTRMERHAPSHVEYPRQCWGGSGGSWSMSVRRR